MGGLVPDRHQERIERRREAPAGVPEVAAGGLGCVDCLIRRTRDRMGDLGGAPRDRPALRSREDALRAPPLVQDEVDRGVHICVVWRGRPLQDPLEAGGALLAGAHWGIVGHAVEAEPERATRALAADRLPLALAAESHAALSPGERMAAD